MTIELPVILTCLCPVEFNYHLHSAYESKRRNRPHPFTVEVSVSIQTALPHPLYCKPISYTQTYLKPFANLMQLVIVVTRDGEEIPITVPYWDELQEAKILYSQGYIRQPRTIINKITEKLLNTLIDHPLFKRYTKATLRAIIRGLLWDYIQNKRGDYGIFKIKQTYTAIVLQPPDALEKLYPDAFQKFHFEILNAIGAVVHRWFGTSTVEGGLDWDYPVSGDVDVYDEGLEVTPTCMLLTCPANALEPTFIEDNTVITHVSYGKSNYFEAEPTENISWTDELRAFIEENLDEIKTAIIDAYNTYIAPIIMKEVGL